MNYAMIFYLIGNLFKVEAGLLLLPLLVAAIYGESATYPAFALTILLLLLLGVLLTLRSRKTGCSGRGRAFSSSGCHGFCCRPLGRFPLSFRGRFPALSMRFLRRSRALPPPARAS